MHGTQTDMIIICVIIVKMHNHELHDCDDDDDMSCYDGRVSLAVVSDWRWTRRHCDNADLSFFIVSVELKLTDHLKYTGAWFIFEQHWDSW